MNGIESWSMKLKTRPECARVVSAHGCLSPESESRDGGRCSLNDFKPGQAAGVELLSCNLL